MDNMIVGVPPEPEASAELAMAEIHGFQTPGATEMAATGIMAPAVDPSDAITMPAMAEAAQTAARGSTAPAVDPLEMILMPAMAQRVLLQPIFLYLPRGSSAAFYPHSDIGGCAGCPASTPASLLRTFQPDTPLALPPMPLADPPALPPTPPADPPAPLAPQAHRVPLPGRSMHLPVPPPAGPPAAPAPPAHLPPLPGRLIRVLIRGRPEVEPCLGPPEIPPYPWPPAGGVHPDDDRWVCMDVSMLPRRNVEERNGGVAEPTPERLRARRLPRGPHDKRPRP